MNLIQHYINGKVDSGDSKRKGKVFNPATGNQESEVILGAKSDLDRAVEDKCEELTDGLITCSGSEQGMQGHYGDDESYLSVDMGELVEA